MKKVITLKNPVAITAFSCVGGKKEGDGPLSAGFDEICRDDYFGMKSWEKAETEMQKRSIRRLFSKRNINENDVSVAIGGDLCDQITSTAFAYRDISMPFLGQYTACATMAQSLAVGSVLVSRGAVANALVARRKGSSALLLTTAANELPLLSGRLPDRLTPFWNLWEKGLLSHLSVLGKLWI